MRTIPSSELIINTDGSVFHLHLKPEQLADRIILVGDPGRVETVARHFDSCECEVASREFRTVTGYYHGCRMTVLSTGIGTDNIDIVLTELDALANIDFATRTVKPHHRQLTLLRLGTSGALQPDIPLGTLVFSRISGGLDGMLNFYRERDSVCDTALEEAFTQATRWDSRFAAPYFVEADATLYNAFRDCTVAGITLSAGGFYAPQGRHVRLEPAHPDMLESFERFEWHGLRITNMEMESSAVAGLGSLLGHRAATVCTIIAQRRQQESNPDYSAYIEHMITTALDRLSTLAPSDKPADQ